MAGKVPVFGLGCMLLFSGALLPEAAAQNIKATLSGQVLDPHQQRVPGAEIEATEISRGLRRTTSSDRAGFFHVAGLDPGQYIVKVRLAGFDSYQSGFIELKTGDAANLRVQLTAAGVGTEIEVSASRLPLLDTKQAENLVIMSLTNHRRGCSVAGLCAGSASLRSSLLHREH